MHVVLINRTILWRSYNNAVHDVSLISDELR